MVLNAAADECACPSGQKAEGGICIAGDDGCGDLRVYVMGDLAICGASLPETTTYTPSECSAAGWRRSVVRDLNNNIAELCEIPHLIVASDLSDLVPNVLSESSTFNLTFGARGEACIIRSLDGYQNPDNLPRCNDLFGTGGKYPEQSESLGGRVEVVIKPNQPSGVKHVPSQQAAGASDDGDSNGVLYYAGALGIAVLLWQQSAGEVPIWHFTPSAEFSHHNGSGFYSYGSHLGYTTTNWSGYWRAAQTGNNGESGNWVYGAGTSWTGDVFAASMNNTTQDNDSDTAFSLSARKKSGIWTVESAYIADLEMRELNTTWKSRLSLGASAAYDKWTVSPSAEFSWRPNESIGKNAGFRLDLRRDL